MLQEVDKSKEYDVSPHVRRMLARREQSAALLDRRPPVIETIAQRLRRVLGGQDMAAAAGRTLATLARKQAGEKPPKARGGKRVIYVTLAPGARRRRR